MPKWFIIVQPSELVERLAKRKEKNGATLYWSELFIYSAYFDSDRRLDFTLCGYWNALIRSCKDIIHLLNFFSSRYFFYIEKIETRYCLWASRYSFQPQIFQIWYSLWVVCFFSRVDLKSIKLVTSKLPWESLKISLNKSIKCHKVILLSKFAYK